MNITFIEAGGNDINTLLDLMQDYYAYDHIPYDRQAAQQALKQLVNDLSLGRIWLVRSDDEIAGYCVLTLWYSLEFRGRCAFIDELFVKEGHRGHGIGTQALEFLKRTAREMGVKALRLEVERKNADALELYRRAGFVTEDRDLMTCRAFSD